MPITQERGAQAMKAEDVAEYLSADRLNPDYASAIRALIAERDALRAALQRLVDLKDGPRDAVYLCTKEAAWQAARDALAHNPVPKGEGDRRGGGGLSGA